MPEGLAWKLVLALIAVTLYWAAIWYWLPALFKDRDRKPPQPRSGEQDAKSK